MVEKRGKVCLMPTLTFANSVLTEYSSQPLEQQNPRKKDGVLNLIGNIASTINKKKEFARPARKHVGFPCASRV